VREGRAPDSRPLIPPPTPTPDASSASEYETTSTTAGSSPRDHGDRVVLVARDIGSIPAHVLLLLTTGGVGNLLYGWYNYAELAERVGSASPTARSRTANWGRPATATRSSPSPATSWAAFSCWSGSGSPPSRSGRARLGALFGLAFAALGLALSPPAERRLDRRHGLSRFGRIRTVDHRITPSTERTEAPCVVCGEAFERGVVRRRRDETVVAGVPDSDPLAAVQPLLRRLRRAGCSAATPTRRRSIGCQPRRLQVRRLEFGDSEFGRDGETGGAGRGADRSTRPLAPASGNPFISPFDGPVCTTRDSATRPARSARERTTRDRHRRLRGREYALDDPAIDVLRPRSRRRSSVSAATTPTTPPSSTTTCRTALLFLKPPNAGWRATATRSRSPRERPDRLGGRIAVVIGEQCKDVDADDAMDVVASFTCMNDVSNRDDQDREQNWVRGKAFDGAAPLGP